MRFIGAYLLGYADSDCFIVQQLTDRLIEFIQFQTGIDIFLARPKRLTSEYISYLPFFKQAFEGSRFFGGAYFLTLQILA